ALLVGTAVGYGLATRVPMTAMPELVAAFNGLGGLASALVAIAVLVDFVATSGALPLADRPFRGPMLAAALPARLLLGTAPLTGRAIACLKRAGKNGAYPIAGPLRNQAHIALGVVVLAVSVWLAFGGDTSAVIAMILLFLLSAVAGHFLVTPIGGADMPVVVALLNSLSGVAAAASGFVVQNQVLIVSGALVGASGLILTRIMCRAMNRSLA